MSSEGRCEQHPDSAAYVLGALEPDETTRFQTHLRGCAQCREDVVLLQAGVEVLARDVPPIPMPGELRDRVMRQVRSEAELLHAAGAGADRPQPRRRRIPRLTLLGAALAAACGLAVGGIFLGSGGQLHSQTVSAQVASTAAGGRAQLVRTGTHAELVVSGIPQPPRGHIYEVWVAGANGVPQPTDALFSVDRAGRGSIDVPGSLRGLRRLMVTAEPLGGSRHPTSAPIIIASI